MRQIKEFAERLHSEYVKDDCIQIMLGYRNFAQIYGNGKLMYYHYLCRDIKVSGNETAIINIDKMNKYNYKNEYLLDERSSNFPFASTPCHSERVRLIYKLIFTNQILDYNKPYIKVNDGWITKLVAYKDKEGAIVHTSILNNIHTIPRKITVSKEELEEYLKNGSLSGYDNIDYNSVQIFDLKGGLYDIELRSRDYYSKRTEKELTTYLEVCNESEDRFKSKLKDIIQENDNPLEYCVLSNKNMIKFNDKGETKIDVFGVRYVGNDKYLITIANIPLDIEELSDIKKRLGEDNIEYAKAPKMKRKILFK